MESKQNTFFPSTVKHLQCLGYDLKLLDISRIGKMWSTLKGKENQQRPAFIRPRYRNWQDFKAAIIILSAVREKMLTMNEKNGKSQQRKRKYNKKPNGNLEWKKFNIWNKSLLDMLNSRREMTKVDGDDKRATGKRSIEIIQSEEERKDWGKKWIEFWGPLG